MKIKYNGYGHRVITQKDFKSSEIDHKDISFDSDNDFTIEASKEVFDFLVTHGEPVVDATKSEKL